MSELDINEMNDALDMAIDAEREKHDAELTRLRKIEHEARRLITHEFCGDVVEPTEDSQKQHRKEQAMLLQGLRKALNSPPATSSPQTPKNP